MQTQVGLELVATIFIFLPLHVTERTVCSFCHEGSLGQNVSSMSHSPTSFLSDVTAKGGQMKCTITHGKNAIFHVSLIIIRMFRIMQAHNKIYNKGAVVFIHCHAEMLHFNEVID